MSWVKSVQYSGEDVFDEDADDINLQDKEWKYNMKKRVKDGYVDGIDHGKEASLQLGFNMGYREGAEKTIAVGRLKGVISAIQCWCQFQRPDNPIPASVADLLQRVVKHEDYIMEAMRMGLENPMPSVSDVSETMEDLAVGEGEMSCGGAGCSKGSGCCKKSSNVELGSFFFTVPGESLEQLLQCCMDIVSELGLPLELIQHLEQLKSATE
ncbi:OTU deubiquitinase with linear linkage specificity a [Esox lucius]|uniref:Essential protein Yae1 N-terminal domain-containing protein n=1 Tax=Esox lucius TaxID=8010 RepID=A0AAY5KP92_ESOLU|nr:OTU deubiquitinase with linear linkage specificity a [Esox lucius]